MLRKNYYGLDIAKFVSAFLVICVHTAPLKDINADANFFLVQILARLAVPLFFVISGFLFFSKLDTAREWNDYENKARLKHYLFRLGKLYLIWTILYLPFSFLLLRGERFSAEALLGYARDFFFNGSYYHLWFLPALMLAVCVVYFLRSHTSMKLTMSIAFVLYLIGMAGNVYAPLLEKIPGVSAVFQQYTEVFTTTRNGLFFGVMYVALGSYFAKRRLEVTHSHLAPALGLLVSFALLCVEAILLRQTKLMQDMTSMYLCLIPTVSFLFVLLLQIELRPRPLYRMMRVLSLLLYVSHIMFVVVLFALFPAWNTLYIYLLSTLAALLFSLAVALLSEKWKLLRHFY